MRAPQNRIIFIPEAPKDVTVAGVRLELPYGVSGKDQAWKDRIVTGTLACDTTVDMESDGFHYTQSLKKGDKILFHYNVLGEDLQRESSFVHDGVKYGYCGPTKIFAYWRNGVFHPYGPWVFTSRAHVRETMLPSGIIQIGSDTTLPNGNKVKEMIKDGEGEFRDCSPLVDAIGGGWQDVAEGDTLVFPSSNQVEVSLTGEAGHMNRDNVVYRQHYKLVWGYRRQGRLTMLRNFIAIRPDPEPKSRIITFGKYTDVSFGTVIHAGPESTVPAGDRVAYNDVTHWRLSEGAEILHVVSADGEGVFYAC